MTEFETTNSKTKTLFLIFGSLLFVLLGLWIVSDPERFADSRRGWMAPYAGWAAIIFFSLGFVVGLRRMFDNRPKIRADSSGLYAAYLSPETIPWTVIRNMGFASYKIQGSRQNMAVLEIDPIDQSQIRFSRLYKMNKGMSKMMGFDGPHFVLNQMNHHPDEIEAALTQVFNYYRR